MGSEDRGGERVRACGCGECRDRKRLYRTGRHGLLQPDRGSCGRAIENSGGQRVSGIHRGDRHAASDGYASKTACPQWSRNFRMQTKRDTRLPLAIMTTDTHEKEVAVEIELGGKTVTIGGMCKGSGMIHPNMCTMLEFCDHRCGDHKRTAAGSAERGCKRYL